MNPLSVSFAVSYSGSRSLLTCWLSQHWDFWVALVCQIIIIVGYFIFFRKEQLVRLLSSWYWIQSTDIKHLDNNRASHKLAPTF